jgi:hypothetical protein
VSNPLTIGTQTSMQKRSIDVLILDLKIVIVVLKLWSYVLYYIAAVFVHILL